MLTEAQGGAAPIWDCFFSLGVVLIPEATAERLRGAFGSLLGIRRQGQSTRPTTGEG